MLVHVVHGGMRPSQESECHSFRLGTNIVSAACGVRRVGWTQARLTDAVQ